MYPSVNPCRQSGLLALFLFIFPVQLLFAQEVSSYNGLSTFKAETASGTITLRLPEDMHVSERISGQVTYSPGSMQPRKLEKQLTFLGSHAFIIGEVHVEGEGMFEIMMPSHSQATIELIDLTGKQMFTYTINLQSPGKEALLQIPKMLRKGFTEKITGPFSGSYKDITLSLGGQPADLLAASEQGVFFECSDIAPGTHELILKTPELQENQIVHLVDLSLEAGQSDLLPGQQTQITVTITGLEGIEDPVDLSLTNLTSDVVSMEGGDSQVISVAPDEIQEDGIWRRTFTISGKHRGDFSITSDLMIQEEESKPAEDPGRIVDCDLDGFPVLVPASICEELRKRIDDLLVPWEDALSIETPVNAEFGSLPEIVEPGSRLSVSLRTDEGFVPHFVLFETFRITDSLLAETHADTIPADGFGFTHQADLDPGLYAVRANIYYGINQQLEIQSYVTQRGTRFSPEIENSPEVTRVNDQMRDAERRSSGLRARLEALERERRRLDSLATVERNQAREHEQVVRELEAIDQTLDAVEGIYSARLRQLINSLAHLPAIPDTGQLRQELNRLKDALAACLQQLERLQNEEKELIEQIPAMEQVRIDEYRKIFDYLKQTGYGYAGFRKINAKGDLEYGYGIILRSGGKIEYLKGIVPLDVASEINEQDKKIKALNQQLREMRARLEALPGLIQATQAECDHLQQLVSQAEEDLASGKALADQNASLRLQRDEICREIRNLLGRLLRWCDQHPERCTFRDQMNRFLETCPNDSLQLAIFWNHFNETLAAKRGIEQQEHHQAEEHHQNERNYRDRARQAERGITEAENELEDLAHEMEELARQRQAAARQARQRMEAEARQREQRERERRDNCVRMFAQWMADNQEYLDDDNLDALETIVNGLEASAEAAAEIASGMASGAATGVTVTSAVAAGLISLGASIFYGWFQSAATAAVKKIADKHVVDLINAQLAFENRKCGVIDPDPPPPPSYFFFRQGNKLLIFRISASHGFECLGETTSF